MRNLNILFRYLVLLTWGLPYTIIGLLIFMILRITRQITEVYVIEGYTVGVFKNSKRNLNLGFCIAVSNLYSERPLLNGMGQARQVMVYGGILYPIIIGIPRIIRCIFRKDTATWFERQAVSWGIKYYG